MSGRPEQSTVRRCGVMAHPAMSAGVFVVVVAAGCFPFAGTDPSPLEVTVAAGAAPARVDSIWPGYAPREQGFLLYEPGRSAILVTSHEPPRGFAPVADTLLPAPLRGRTYAYEGGLPGLEGNLDTEYRIGALVTTAYSPSGSLGESLSGIYHEAFHGYQREHFAPDGVTEETVPAQALTREFVAMAEVERRILARALEVAPGPALDSLLRGFLAVRRERLQGLPPRVQQVERALERREGSANLVGFEMAAATLGYDRERVARAIENYLTVRLDRFGGDRATQIMRWRAYGTGATMGLLLDRKGVAWRKRLEQGEAFDVLLAESVSPDPRGSEALARETLEAFGYDDVLETVADAESPAEQLKAFYRMAPVRLVIEILPRDSTVQTKFGYNFSTGFLDWLLRRRQGVSAPESGLTVVWDPDVFHATGFERGAYNLRVEGRPVLVDLRRKERGQYVVLLPELPTVQGERAPEGRREYPEGLVIEGEGTRFETALPATLVVSAPDSIHVRISP
ncbi:MAG TPA: hypothetical protein VF188_18600 [Longimicrobiales bacterium]